MTKYLGLTPAMRKALVDGFRSHASRRDALAKGFVRLWTIGGLMSFSITQRGHAALAAPKMTQAEFEMLTNVENGKPVFEGNMKGTRTFERLLNREFLDFQLSSPLIIVSPAGRTALNNIRAAIGSPDYEETS
jgi:hypothetical protein